jgi:decaprenylphospho-beta-D-erythro-pentofuranosid-2-ulose 2-reductase
VANIVIVGATSAIAQATARSLCEKKPSFLLVGRNRERLDQLAEDLRVRGADSVFVHVAAFDEIQNSGNVLQAAISQLGTVDTILMAHGILPDQTEVEKNSIQLQTLFAINCVNTILLIREFAEYFEGQGSGALAVITSVAGDRGRPSNFAYGASKSAVSIYLEGLASRLQGTNISVIDIKPGLVDTPMTALLDKRGLFWSTSTRIAKDIVRALDKTSGVVYTPWFWRHIMRIVRYLPGFVIRRM